MRLRRRCWARSGCWMADALAPAGQPRPGLHPDGPEHGAGLSGARTGSAARGFGGRSAGRTAVASLLISALAAQQLGLFLGGLSPRLEALLVPDPEHFGSVPTARMSPVTAFAFLSAGLSLFLVGSGRGRRAPGDVGGGLALLVSLLGLPLLLGYAHGTPLLYTASVIPMALPTALAFGCLGTGLITLAGADRLPLRPLSGPSAQARLLRTFLPIAPVVMISDLLLPFIPVLNPVLHRGAAGAAVGGRRDPPRHAVCAEPRPEHRHRPRGIASQRGATPLDAGFHVGGLSDRRFRLALPLPQRFRRGSRTSSEDGVDRSHDDGGVSRDRGHRGVCRDAALHGATQARHPGERVHVP